MLSPAHVRMARAALNWTLKDLEAKTGVNKNTISRYEAGASILTATLEKLESAFKAEGLLFFEEDSNSGPGVRLPKSLRSRLGPARTKSTKKKLP